MPRLSGCRQLIASSGKPALFKARQEGQAGCVERQLHSGQCPCHLRTCSGRRCCSARIQSLDSRHAVEYSPGTSKLAHPNSTHDLIRSSVQCLQTHPSQTNFVGESIIAMFPSSLVRLGLSARWDAAPKLSLARILQCRAYAAESTKVGSASYYVSVIDT